MTQLRKKDNMLVHAPPGISEREEIEPMGKAEIYKLEKGHVALGREIPMP